MELFNIELILGIIIGVILGFLLTKLLGSKPSSSSGSGLTSEKNKLEKEVLQDHIKQLNAKIETLEKALEIS